MSNYVSWQQIVYMYKSIAMRHIAVNMSVTGFGTLYVSCWFVRIYFFRVCTTNCFYTFNVIELKPDTCVAWWASHALVSCLVSPRESKNPVIKIIMFSVISKNNMVLNAKPFLFDFIAVFCCNLILFACCCNICIWNVHNKRYFAITLLKCT